MAWLLALLKLIPGLAKILAKLEETMRYAQAEQRREAKHSRVDDAIADALASPHDRDGLHDDETK